MKAVCEAMFIVLCWLPFVAVENFSCVKTKTTLLRIDNKSLLNIDRNMSEIAQCYSDCCKSGKSRSLTGGELCLSQ